MLPENRLTLPAIFLALGIALAGLLISYALVSTRTADRSVTVKGLAEKQVMSDTAIWQIQFSYASDELEDLYQGVAAAQQKIKDYLIRAGFDIKNMQVQTVTITDNQSSNYNENAKAKRYNASSGVVLSTEQIKNIAQALQQTSDLVKSGVIITNSQVQYNFTQLNAIKPEMLNTATTYAKQAAESFANNSQSRLGNILSANQGLFTISNADGSYGSTDPNKIIRVVTTVEYGLN